MASADAVGVALTLDDALRRALAHSPALVAASATTDGSEARVATARSAYFPRFDLEHTVSRSNNPVYVFGSLLTQQAFSESNFAIDSLNRPGPLTNHQTGLVLEQSLFDGGRRRLAVRDAHLGHDVSAAARREVEMQVVFATIRAYYAISVHRAAVALLDSTLALAAADLDRSEARRAAGLATDADVLAVRVHRAEVEAQRIQAANALDLSHVELARLVGLSLDERFVTQEGLEDQAARLAATERPLGELERIALAHRPDLQRAALHLQRAANARAQARSSFWPMVGLRAGREWDRPSLTEDGGTNWMLAVSVRLNLFDGLERYSRITEAAAAEGQMTAERDLAEENARVEVRRAALDLRAARAQVAVASDAVELAREGSRITAERYDVGLASMTELLRARNALLAVETRRNEALYRHRLADAALEMALGTLDTSPQDDGGAP